MPESSSRMKIEVPWATPTLKLSEGEQAAIREAAKRAAQACGWTGSKCGSRPRDNFRKSARKLAELERKLFALKSGEPSDDLQWMYDNLRLVRADVQDLESGSKILARLPAVRTQQDGCIPRPVALARALMQATSFRLTEPAFFYFVQAVEE